MFNIYIRKRWLNIKGIKLKIEKYILKRIIITIVVGVVVSLLTFFVIPIILELYIWAYYITFLKFFWVFCLIYISLQLKKDLDIKGLIYFTNIVTLAIFIIDTIAQYIGLYETATEFFVLSYDMASHFAAGFVFFLIFVMFISIVEIKYKVENIALISTNVALFIWEILEELLELFYGGTLEGFANYFFWNGVQDMIFNLLGSLTALLIVKLYFKKKRKEIELKASIN